MVYKDQICFLVVLEALKLEMTMESGDGFLLDYPTAEGRRAERATSPRITFITALNTVMKGEPSYSSHPLKLSIPLKNFIFS